MSKSDSSEYSCINLDDTDDLIVKKIEKAKTDSILGFDFAKVPFGSKQFSKHLFSA